MPTATEKLRVDLDRLNAEVREAGRQFATLAARLLRDCLTISEGVQFARSSVEADLCKGVETATFVKDLEPWKAYGSDVLEVYAAVRADLAGWQMGIEALADLVKDAEDFVAWIDDLLARLARPWPPIDESKLPSPGAVGPGQAPGFVSVDEARRRLHARTKP